MVRSLALLLGAVLAFAAGYAVQASRTRTLLETQRLRADSVLQAVTVQHARARDSLERVRRQAEARADSTERTAARLRQRATALLGRIDQVEATLSHVTTAADSLPLVLTQRDGLRQVVDSLAAGYDSLLLANGSLRTTVAAGDSLLDLSHRDAAAREAALHSLNAELRLELDRARNRGKLLGLVRIPDWVKAGAGVVAGYCLAGGCR